MSEGELNFDLFMGPASHGGVMALAKENKPRRFRLTDSGGDAVMKGVLVPDDMTTDQRVLLAIDLLKGTPYRVRTRVDEGDEE